MFKFKKVVATIMAVALVGTISTIAFANTRSKRVNGYGTLYGSLNSKGAYVTSVSYNRDSAKLQIGGTIQDRNGRTIARQQNIYSNRGATRMSGYWTRVPSNSYALYGAHGVQNGRTYGAGVVYTYTRA